MKTQLALLAVILILAGAQQCDMPTDERADCGYMGINQQQCEAKSCCWKPARLLSQA
jgi:hypothetical protein